MPIITLLTDFGTSDSYVAETKAAILGIAPEARLLDVTHELDQGDIRAAQYLLDRTWRRSPRGTVHLVVVDPGVGTERRALAALAAGHGFVAPDNGVLTPVLADDAQVVALPVPADASATFHGRDLFAPAAARLACGEPLESLGTPVTDPIRTQRPAPSVRGGAVVGEVIYIDRFGTLITNIRGDALDGAAGVSLAGRYDAVVGRTFGDVAPGELVAFAGSGGTVEVAARDRSAAQLTGLSIGAEVRVSPTPP